MADVNTGEPDACPGCSAPFTPTGDNVPKLPSCLHTSCLRCLRSGGKCAVVGCGRAIDVKNPASLSDDLTVLNRIVAAPVCANCQGRNWLADSRCTQCDMVLCAFCWDCPFHAKLGPQHTRVRLGPVIQLEALHCEIHGLHNNVTHAHVGEAAEAPDKLLCSVCVPEMPVPTAGDSPVAGVVDVEGVTAANHVATAREWSRTLASDRNIVATEKQAVQQEHDTVTRQIDDAVEVVCAKACELGDQLKAINTALHNERDGLLGEQLVSLDDYAARFARGLQQMALLRALDGHDRAAQAALYLRSLARECGGREWPIAPCALADVCFDGTDATELVTLGSVLEEGVHPLLCTARGNGLERVLLGKKAEFTITAHDWHGDRVTSGGALFDVVVVPPCRKGCHDCDHVSTIQGSVVDNHDGTYGVRYTLPSRLESATDAVRVKVVHVSRTSGRRTPVRGSPFKSAVGNAGAVGRGAAAAGFAETDDSFPAFINENGFAGTRVFDRGTVFAQPQLGLAPDYGMSTVSTTEFNGDTHDWYVVRGCNPGSQAVVGVVDARRRPNTSGNLCTDASSAMLNFDTRRGWIEGREVEGGVFYTDPIAVGEVVHFCLTFGADGFATLTVCRQGGEPYVLRAGMAGPLRVAVDLIGPGGALRIGRGRGPPQTPPIRALHLASHDGGGCGIVLSDDGAVATLVGPSASRRVAKSIVSLGEGDHEWHVYFESDVADGQKQFVYRAGPLVPCVQVGVLPTKFAPISPSSTGCTITAFTSLSFAVFGGTIEGRAVDFGTGDRLECGLQDGVGPAGVQRSPCLPGRIDALSTVGLRLTLDADCVGTLHACVDGAKMYLVAENIRGPCVPYVDLAYPGQSVRIGPGLTPAFEVAPTFAKAHAAVRVSEGGVSLVCSPGRGAADAEWRTALSTLVDCSRRTDFHVLNVKHSAVGDSSCVVGVVSAAFDPTTGSAHVNGKGAMIRLPHDPKAGFGVYADGSFLAVCEGIQPRDDVSHGDAPLGIRVSPVDGGRCFAVEAYCGGKWASVTKSIEGPLRVAVDLRGGAAARVGPALWPKR